MIIIKKYIIYFVTICVLICIVLIVFISKKQELNINTVENVTITFNQIFSWNNQLNVSVSSKDSIDETIKTDMKIDNWLKSDKSIEIFGEIIFIYKMKNGNQINHKYKCKDGIVENLNTFFNTDEIKPQILNINRVDVLKIYEIKLELINGQYNIIKDDKEIINKIFNGIKQQQNENEYKYSQIPNGKLDDKVFVTFLDENNNIIYSCTLNKENESIKKYIYK